mmetsp:Transcript_705/g.1085  ORF Transcript_705/g.1085 Transcript_705/m.1085 type:complete len:87 (-) Transcript_705:81-341(-)
MIHQTLASCSVWEISQASSAMLIINVSESDPIKRPGQDILRMWLRAFMPFCSLKSFVPVRSTSDFKTRSNNFGLSKKAMTPQFGNS